MGSDCSDANKFAEHRKAVDKRANVTSNYPADLNRKILRKPLNSWDYCKNSRTIQRRKQKQENIVLGILKQFHYPNAIEEAIQPQLAPGESAKVGGPPSAGMSFTGAIVLGLGEGIIHQRCDSKRGIFSNQLCRASAK